MEKAPETLEIFVFDTFEVNPEKEQTPKPEKVRVFFCGRDFVVLDMMVPGMKAIPPTGKLQANLFDPLAYSA